MSVEKIPAPCPGVLKITMSPGGGASFMQGVRADAILRSQFPGGPS
jgi:hypothetical protein